MPDYVRAFMPGGTFFFTVVTYHRRPIFESPRARTLLREAIAGVQERRPFELEAIVLLPDHLHCIWALPPDDHDFSTRWRKLKEDFTRSFLAAGGVEGPVDQALDLRPPERATQEGSARCMATALLGAYDSR